MLNVIKLISFSCNSKNFEIFKLILRKFNLIKVFFTAEELQDSQCGKITSGKAIPNFCPSTRSDCRIVDGGPAIPGQVPWQVGYCMSK